MIPFLLVACAPILPDDTPLVDTPRVLAVRADPPEAEAGVEVALQALFADGTGELDAGDVTWSFCPDPKPLAELGPVSRTCLDPASPDLIPIGTGLDVTGAIPADACSLFGPNPPPPVPGQPNGRPADPDITGGFYQPALAFLDGTPTLVPVRVRCGIANVAQETYVAWNQGYHSNENPEVLSLDLPSTVGPGEGVTLAVSWPECPEAACGDGLCVGGEDIVGCAEDCTAPVGCGGAETYLVYEPGTKELLTRREAMSATWFTTGGTFDVARNGRTGDDAELSLENGWTAPDEPGEVWIAVVLRDERGGIDFASGRVTVGSARR